MATNPVPSPAPAPTPVQPTPTARPQDTTADPVAEARTEIDRRLEGTGLFGQRTQDDSKAILDQFRTLSPADASRLARELSAAGKLDDIADMTTDGTMLVGDGVSASDRQQFFAEMARKLDGAAMAELSRAYGSVGQGDGTAGGRPDAYSGADYAREIGQAVATHGTTADKIAFVRTLAADTTAPGHQSQFQNGVFSHEVRQGNAQAGAVGEVLGSLRGEAATAAFQSLSNPQLQAVFAASVGERLTLSGGAMPREGAVTSGSQSTRYDTAGYDQIAQAAASMTDPHLKAQVFAAGTATIRSERIDNEVLAHMVGVSPESSRGAVAAMSNSLARIIESDPDGVVHDLAEFRGSPSQPGEVATADGSALATYAKAMIQSGEEGRGRLGAQLGMVAAGDGSQPNAAAAFNHSTGGNYVTAESLGYFVGAVSAASKAIDTDVAAQRELITGVLQSGLSVADKGLGDNPAAAIAKDWLGTALSSWMQGPGTSVSSDLFNAAVPRTSGGYDDSRSAPFSAFESNLGAVERFAQP